MARRHRPTPEGSSRLIEMRERCPVTGKRSYPDRENARLARKRFKKTRGEDRLSIYQCNACGYFHLGRHRGNRPLTGSRQD